MSRKFTINPLVSSAEWSIISPKFSQVAGLRFRDRSSRLGSCSVHFSSRGEKMRISFYVWAGRGALFFILGSWLFGSPVGSVAGTAKDPSGSVVPGVKVTLSNSSTNAKFVTMTNANGEFQFLQLAPSNYSL